MASVFIRVMFTAANESTNCPVTEPATEPSKLAPVEATRRTSAGVDISAKLALNELIELAKLIGKPGAPFWTNQPSNECRTLALTRGRSVDKLPGPMNWQQGSASRWAAPHPNPPTSTRPREPACSLGRQGPRRGRAWPLERPRVDRTRKACG